jgi:hypothetical protein
MGIFAVINLFTQAHANNLGNREVLCGIYEVYEGIRVKFGVSKTSLSG